MSEIAPIGRPNQTGFKGKVRASYVKPEAAPTRGSDQVQFSDRARLLSKLRSLPDVRSELVDSVKTQIANGTYETPEKIDSILDDVRNALG